MNKSVPMRIVLLGVRQPDISGSTLIFREIERALSADTRFDVRVVDLSGIRKRGVRGIFRYFSRIVSAARLSIATDGIFLFTIGSGLIWTLPVFAPLAWLTRSHLFVRCTGGTAHTHGGKVRQWLVRKFLSRAKLYMVETELLRSHAHSVGLSQTVATPNGRHLESIHFDKHDYKARWVMVSRFIRTKGVFEAINAFRDLSDISLDLIGPLDGICEAELQLPDNVRWLGPIPSSRVTDVLYQYDGFIFPTYYATEGHAGVIIEAMAAGLPVVSTHFRSIPEVVDESCGILVPIKDVAALSHAVRKLHEDDGLRNRLSAGALVRSRDFDWKNLNAEFQKQLNEALQ